MVDVSQMSVDVRFDRECLLAELAREGSFSSVDSHVFLHVTSVRRGLATVRAHPPLFGLISELHNTRA